MHIVTVSPERWLTDDAVFGSTGARITRIIGSFADRLDDVVAAAPDVLFVAGIGPVHEFLQTLGRVQSHLPQCRVAPLLHDPDRALLLQLVRAGVADLLVDDTAQSIRAVVERSGAKSVAMQDAHEPAPKRRGHRTAFLAAKGGDGATFVAVNHAVSLAQGDAGVRVLLLDLSLPFGDAEIYLTPQKPSHDLADFILEIDRLDGALLKAMVHHVQENLDFIPSPLTLYRVVQIAPDQIPGLIDRVADHYDHVVIDLGSGIDPVTMAVLDKVDQLVLVATLEVPSVRRASQILHMWDSLDYPQHKLGLVINRQSPNSGITPQAFEKAVGRSIDRFLPAEGDKVRDSVAKGTPYVELAPSSRFAREMADWSANSVGAPAKGKSLWQRLRNR